MQNIFHTYQIKEKCDDLLANNCYVASSPEKDCAILLQDVENTYLPQALSELLLSRFSKAPESLISSLCNGTFLSDTEAKKAYEGILSKWLAQLNEEQRFVSDHYREQCQYSGVKIAALRIENGVLHYYLIGDCFLFIYNKQNEQLTLYCSMLGDSGKLDYAAEQHCLFSNNSTRGAALKGIVAMSDSVVFLLPRDFAKWFIDEYTNNSHDVIEKIFAIKNRESFCMLVEEVKHGLAKVDIWVDDNNSAIQIMDYQRRHRSIVHGVVSIIKQERYCLFAFFVLLFLLFWALRSVVK